MKSLFYGRLKELSLEYVRDYPDTKLQSNIESMAATLLQRSPSGPRTRK